MPVLTPLIKAPAPPVIIVPQVYLCEPEELGLQIGRSWVKEEIIIPILIGLGLAISLSATGTAGGYTGQ